MRVDGRHGHCGEVMSPRTSSCIVQLWLLARFLRNLMTSALARRPSRLQAVLFRTCTPAGLLLQDILGSTAEDNRMWRRILLALD